MLTVFNGVRGVIVLLCIVIWALACTKFVTGFVAAYRKAKAAAQAIDEEHEDVGDGGLYLRNRDAPSRLLTLVCYCLVWFP